MKQFKINVQTNKTDRLEEKLNKIYKQRTLEEKYIFASLPDHAMTCNAFKKEYN